MLQYIKKFVRRFVESRTNKTILPGLTSKECELISNIRSKNLTYLTDRKLVGIANTCRSIKNSGLPGIFLEAGCALGGSAILMASLKSSNRPFLIYDVFEMIPPPTEEDSQDSHDRYQQLMEGKSKGIGDGKYYGYVENLYDIVRSNLQDFGINCEEQCVSLIKGLVGIR